MNTKYVLKYFISTLVCRVANNGTIVPFWYISPLKLHSGTITNFLVHFTKCGTIRYNKIWLGVRTERTEGIVVFICFSSRVLSFRLNIYLSTYSWPLAVIIYHEAAQPSVRQVQNRWAAVWRSDTKIISAGERRSSKYLWKKKSDTLFSLL